MAFLVLAFLFTAISYAKKPPAEPNLGTCFGKKVTQVIKSGGVVRLNARDVVRVAGVNADIRARSNTTVCADRGDQVIRAGKGVTRIRTGSGDDVIYLHSKTGKSVIEAGSGDDVIYGSRGPDLIYASGSTDAGLSDVDTVFAAGGNDRVYDFAGNGNTIYTQNGSDKIWSLGSSTSSVWSGNGSDFIYSNGAGHAGAREYLFGERGNDRLLADRPGGLAGAFLDPGPGDDWVQGTGYNDRILFQSGIKKINALGGDDLLISRGRGMSDIYGGEGRDTISFAGYTPLESDDQYGVYVNLEEGEVRGQGDVSIYEFEDVIGSAFEDRISGKVGVDNRIFGSLGDDILRGNRSDGDVAFGGLGKNRCFDFSEENLCDADSSETDTKGALLGEIDDSGVLLLIDSESSNDIRVDYDANRLGYVIQSATPAVASGLCLTEDGGLFCPDHADNLNGLLLYASGGDDTILFGNGISKDLTTTIHGGSGVNTIYAGKSKDTILTSQGDSAGSVLRAGGGVDNIYIQDNVFAEGEEGHDVIHAKDPCLGGRAQGDEGRDNLVFAGAEAGVWASIEAGIATWRQEGCIAPLQIAPSTEALEGTRYDDHLIIGKRFPEQEGPGKLLGREGIDTLDARNGYKDSITTGSGGRDNIVFSDSLDKIIWGWGLSGY